MRPMSIFASMVLGFIAVLRAAEVMFSAWRIYAEKHAANAASANADKVSVQPVAEWVFPWMVAVHAGWYVATALESLLAPVAYGSYQAAILWGAGLVWAGSLALRVWLWLSLGRLWNVRIVVRKQQPIVTAGPYRWIRHPNYVAVILEIAAVPLLLGAPWVALLGSVANALVLIPRIRREEAYLFGVPGYASAFQGKKRFLPGIV
jgi:methyltransferase